MTLGNPDKQSVGSYENISLGTFIIVLLNVDRSWTLTGRIEYFQQGYFGNADSV